MPKNIHNKDWKSQFVTFGFFCVKIITTTPQMKTGSNGFLHVDKEDALAFKRDFFLKAAGRFISPAAFKKQKTY